MKRKEEVHSRRTVGEETSRRTVEKEALHRAVEVRGCKSIHGRIHEQMCRTGLDRLCAVHRNGGH